MPDLHDHVADNMGTTAEDVTPADHITAFVIGLARCMEAFSVCTPKKGRCWNTHFNPPGQPSGFPVPPSVKNAKRMPSILPTVQWAIAWQQK